MVVVVVSTMDQAIDQITSLNLAMNVHMCHDLLISHRCEEDLPETCGLEASRTTFDKSACHMRAKLIFKLIFNGNTSSSITRTISFVSGPQTDRFAG